LWTSSRSRKAEIEQERESFVDALFSKKTAWYAEKSGAVRRGELFEKVLSGGYPPLVTRHTEARRKAWFQSYMMTILQRDVRDISNISDLTAVPRLLSVVAGRAGGLLNFADLSRSLSLPQTTLKRYFALLEMTFLVQLLQPWSVNIGQRVIRTPKIYLNDTGLLAHAGAHS
jgi:predicted AAA+ superfamily ATPase